MIAAHQPGELSCCPTTDGGGNASAHVLRATRARASAVAAQLHSADFASRTNPSMKGAPPPLTSPLKGRRSGVARADESTLRGELPALSLRLSAAVDGVRSSLSLRLSAAVDGVRSVPASARSASNRMCRGRRRTPSAALPPVASAGWAIGIVNLSNSFEHLPPLKRRPAACAADLDGARGAPAGVGPGVGPLRWSISESSTRHAERWQASCS